MVWARLSEVVALVEPRLGCGFVAQECLARIQSIAARIPAKASNFFGFERYLGRDDARVDFALGVSAVGAAWLVSARPWPEIGDIFAQSSEHVATGPIRPWLEFDTNRPVDVSAPPSVYVGIDPRTAGLTSMLALIRCLSGGSAHWERTTQRCLALFPESVGRLYVGAMLARNARAVRLNIAAIRLEDLRGYLRGIRWPGDAPAVESLLSHFTSVCRRLCVQIDVAAGVSPRLGIELMLDPAAAGEEASANMIRLLHLLVEQRLCSAFESAQLERWPSQTQYVAPLIDRLIDAAHPRPDERIFHGTLVTALHHVKLAIESDGSVRTKAYFGVFLDSQ